MLVIIACPCQDEDALWLVCTLYKPMWSFSILNLEQMDPEVPHHHDDLAHLSVSGHVSGISSAHTLSREPPTHHQGLLIPHILNFPRVQSRGRMWVSPMSRILEKGIVGLINFPRYGLPKIFSILLPILSIRRSSTWLSCSPNLTYWDKSPKRDILWLRLSLSLCISDNLTYSPRPKRRQGRLRGWHDLGFDLISLLRSGPLSLSICFTAHNLKFLWQWHWILRVWH